MDPVTLTLVAAAILVPSLPLGLAVALDKQQRRLSGAMAVRVEG